MRHPFDTRDEKIVLCPDCNGSGTRTVLDVEPGASKQDQFEMSPGTEDA